MELEIVIGLIVAVLTAIAGTLGLGKSRGTSTTETKVDRQRTEEHATATKVVAKRRVETAKGARGVQQTVNHLPDYGIDHELREKFIRKT